MAFWSIFGTKAAEEGFQVVGKGLDLFNSMFYTKQEKAGDEKEIGMHVDEAMKVNNAAAEYVRSKRRAFFATIILVPYIGGWLAQLPILLFKPELFDTMLIWLKLMSGLAAAAAIPYFSYFGGQMILKAFGDIKNNKKK